MNEREIETLGDPDLRVAGLRVWIHGRQFPDAQDYWDGNWLNATAYCVYPDSIVRVRGSFLHLTEIARFTGECQHLYERLSGKAGLDCMEPNIDVQLSAQTAGHIKVELCLRPDLSTDSHRFTDEFDQTFLPAIISQCKRILERFPLREPEKLPA
jgi:hypothetical protein